MQSINLVDKNNVNKNVRIQFIKTDIETVTVNEPQQKLLRFICILCSRLDLNSKINYSNLFISILLFNDQVRLRDF